MKRLSFLLSMAVVAVVALLGSCTAPKDITYFQDFVPGRSVMVQNPIEIKFKPDDEITIAVSTQREELTKQFALSGGDSRYTIDNEGCIRFPMLGKIHVAGLNRQELQETIREKIMEQNLVRDPIVTVGYSNLYVITLGAMGSGRVQIDRDKFTILDAISKSGDLNINGLRTNVKVIRENYGKKTVYEINLCSGDAMYSSPVYYLQQNDVVYVEMNNKEKRNSTVMGNSTVQPSFWIGMVTLAISTLAWFK